MLEFATLPVDDECRRRPHQVEDAGTTAEHAMLADDEKPARKNGGKCVKRRSGSAGPKQATLEVFATKPETKPFTEDTMPTDSTNGHDAATVHADELEDDLSYRRRKRQRTASAEVEPGLEGTAKHPAPMAGARDDTGTSATLSWDEQLRMEAEGCAEAESDAVSSWEKEEKFVPAMSTEQPVARTHDPVAQLLEDALEQSERDCTPKSVFAGTKWTSGQPEQSNGEPSKPSSKWELETCFSFQSDSTDIDILFSAPPPLPKPTKMLQLKAGKLASPKAKKPQTEVESTTKQRLKRGQKQQKKQVVTVIKYPSISIDRVTMGTKIDGILDGLERFQQPMVALTPKMLLKKVTPKKALPKKPTLPTHPLFLGKAALKAAFQPDVAKKSPDPIVVPKLPSPRKIAGTPGKIRAQAQAHRATMNPPASFGHTFGSFQPRVTKYPGMRDAPWPWKSVAHVRGEISGVAHTEQPDIPETQRKLKHAAIIMNEAEDLIMRCSFDLRSSQSTGSLQIPERVVTSGPDIQRQVATELHTRFKQVANSSDSDGPSVQRGSSRSAPHPALLPIYSSIETNLTPFDKFECESQAWTQKYAPKTAVEVLQSQKESFILRDWLRSSTITAVDTGAHRSTTGSVKPGKPEKPEKKKKRKRAADLDDFIISSDDELAGTGDLEELEDDSAYERSPQKRSLVRGGAETSNHPSKSGNAVVLSGPNGCGKTAAVYAIAKELGFEVFELNSGSRRSGKDVLDKIGDMTENHLVQQVSKALSEDKPEDGKSVAIVDSDAPDPKQGSMISFFKPAAGREKTMPKSSAKSQKDDKAPQPRQQQRQSLILLEEVDVLFEEDKQFWMTVLTLAGHSKRPIVMTCNDESRLPLNALSLHALLRFTPPPIDLAVDYLLLIAAHEGHLLKRSAVKSLYQSRGHDLRGSIMDLDHWCQIGVGDSTGGFAWMLERYPPGIDIDSEGHTLRVASKETCFPGSGLIPYDLVCSSSYTTFDKDEELLLEACERWNLNAEDLLLPQSSLAESDDKLNTDATLTAPTSLLEYGRQSEINSAYDVSCGLGLRSGYEVSLCFNDSACFQRTKFFLATG